MESPPRKCPAALAAAVEAAGAQGVILLEKNPQLGGTTDKTMALAKRALLRKVGEPNPDPEVAELETEILQLVNNLGIGPMGYGGDLYEEGKAKYQVKI